MSKFNVGDLCSIPAETPIWCVTLQDTIKFQKEIICEVTNTTFDDKTYFVKKKEVLFNAPGMIPGAIDGQGEFHVSKEVLSSYKLPPPQIFTYTYAK